MEQLYTWRKYCYYIIAALLFSNCTKVEKIEKITDPISFVVNTNTKGNILNDIPNNTTFGVLGYCYINNQDGESNWETKRVQATPDIFYKQPVTVTEDGCQYSGAAKPWSDNPNDKYSFFAYYPFSGINNNTITISDATYQGAPVLTYQAPFSSTSEDNALERRNLIDIMVSKDIDRTKSLGYVPLHFKHILTALDFAVNNFNDATDIHIISLKVIGEFHKSMAINLEDLSTTISNSYKGYFNILDTPITISPNLTSGMQNICTNSNDNDLNTNNYLLLIPQTIPSSTPNKIRVEVKYRRGDSTTEITENFSLGSPNYNVELNMGVKYTICLDFLGDACFLRVLVSPSWDSVPGEDNNVIFE